MRVFLLILILSVTEQSRDKPGLDFNKADSYYKGQAEYGAPSQAAFIKSSYGNDCKVTMIPSPIQPQKPGVNLATHQYSGQQLQDINTPNLNSHANQHWLINQQLPHIHSNQYPSFSANPPSNSVGIHSNHLLTNLNYQPKQQQQQQHQKQFQPKVREPVEVVQHLPIYQQINNNFYAQQQQQSEKFSQQQQHHQINAFRQKQQHQINAFPQKQLQNNFNQFQVGGFKKPEQQPGRPLQQQHFQHQQQNDNSPKILIYHKKFISQSESSQLDPYPFKQINGNNRPFTRVITHQVKLQNVTDCGDSQISERDYTGLKDRRLFPYSEVVIPQYPYN